MSGTLDFFFEPKSVAVIGASSTPGKAGNEILVNLLANGYSGKIFPINPTEEEILGFKAYRSVKDIPESVDLAVFIVPAEKTLSAVKDCVEKKIPAAVIASGGYAEVDQKGARLQKEILTLARASGMRIIGPNTSGLTSTPASLTTTFFPLGKVRRGPISYIAQTGNFATHTMKWILTAENFGVARVAGLGNKIDVEDAEVLEYLGNDPETKAVLMYVEGFRNPRRFFETAREVTKKKPVIMLKGGRTKAGAERALLPHRLSFGQRCDLRRRLPTGGGRAGEALFRPDPRGQSHCVSVPAAPEDGWLPWRLPGPWAWSWPMPANPSVWKWPPSERRPEKRLREISASWVNISNPVDMSAVTPITGIAEGNKIVLETLLKRRRGRCDHGRFLLASPRDFPGSLFLSCRNSPAVTPINRSMPPSPATEMSSNRSDPFWKAARFPFSSPSKRLWRPCTSPAAAGKRWEENRVTRFKIIKMGTVHHFISSWYDCFGFYISGR